MEHSAVHCCAAVANLLAVFCSINATIRLNWYADAPETIYHVVVF
jgi:hypothetical protein